MKTQAKNIFLVLLAMICCASNAYGYIDPGTGSMVVQAIIATVAIVGVTLKIFWDRFKNLCKSLFSRSSVKGDRKDVH